MSRLLLIIGILLLLLTEILRVYFIMPFPGSQDAATIDFAYFIEKYKWLFRIIGLLLIVMPAYRLYTGNRKWPKILFSVFLLLYAFIFFKFNFRFQADKMFLNMTNKSFSGITGNRIDSNKLVIGVVINGEAKAYPIKIIGYHHQIRDTVGNRQVMVTYCTVCRTGRVYNPTVNGKIETFRLVGMDHFNAMFEDEKTRSWWQQATGVAVAGPLKGHRLEEIASHQASLASWFRQYPNSTVLQPDTTFKKDYEDLEEFDKGTIHGHLEKRDSASWKMKSWVVGIQALHLTKAYDWNDLLKENFIQDTIGRDPVLLVLENDTSTFHAYSRLWQEKALYFSNDKNLQQLTDSNTHSHWNVNGICISGPLKNARLVPLSSYQEFWHSWKQFHPNTTMYNH